MGSSTRIQNKTLNVTLFDVSRSMQEPLRLRCNAKYADGQPDKLNARRAQIVFDVIYRLVEGCIASGMDREMRIAVLCFGLREANTCDLFSLLEKLLVVFEASGVFNIGSPTELSHSEALGLLTARGIDAEEAGEFLKEASLLRGVQQYTVVGHKPLIKLLNGAGAQYCEEFVEKYISPDEAGNYFMAFAPFDGAEAVVDSLPREYRARQVQPYAGTIADFSFSSLILPPPESMADVADFCSRTVSSYAPEIYQRKAVDKVRRFADSILANRLNKDFLPLLKSTPTATPRLLDDVIQLLRRLSSIPKPNRPTDDPSDQGARFLDWEHLLDKFEPFLYGRTPLCEALRSVEPLCRDQSYTSKVIVLISDGAATDGDPLPPANALRDAGGLIFACLLTDRDIEESRRLRAPDEAGREWPSAVQQMFHMASTISCEAGPIQFLRRRGWELPSSGQCQLFIQANNPIVIDEFTAAASRLLTSNSDALVHMLREIHVDDYIRNTIDAARSTNQEKRAICWAHATASVIHLASARVIGRQRLEFSRVRQDLFDYFGDDDEGRYTHDVLRIVCPEYKLRCEECDEAGARGAIYARRPVVATFRLDRKRWKAFSAFYKSKPTGTLTQQEMGTEPLGPGEVGHAVVLVRCDEKSLTFMNSWGEGFANNGFFTVDKASTLGIAGATPMKFYDVFWTEDDLSPEEKQTWTEHEMERIRNPIDALPELFYDLPVTCPLCKTTARARDYTGYWYEARCEICNETFKPTVGALIQTLYNGNYTGL